MERAYDTYLQCEVTADFAAKDNSLEPYRYECAHCREEVHLAAANSPSMVPHFRHRSGNSDVECKDYLGRYGMLSADKCSRKSKNERAEFYFDSNTKMFYLGLRFHEDEISAYEQRSTTFELRVSPQAQPFYSAPIDDKHFISDAQKLIPLEQFSRSYFLSNTLNGIKRKYEVFNNVTSGTVAFFKRQTGDTGYRAKLVRGSVLYTNVPYFIAFPSQSKHCSPVDIHLPNEINIDSTFKFETMGRKFLGKFVTITSRTAQIDSLLSSWGYQLETAETMTLLWPPAIISEDVSLIGTAKAYLYATFELQPHGNINVYARDIAKISDGLIKVAVEPKIKIYKKNVELMIESHKRELGVYFKLSVAHKTERKFQVKDDHSFMFNSSGVFPLSKGAFATMTPNSRVNHYSNGYLDEVVIPPKPTTISEQLLFQDALMYYKRTEPFNWEDFESHDISQTAFQYLEDCEKVGLISYAVKRLIKEGRI